MQADYMACKFLIFINKSFLNILVKHVTLLVGKGLNIAFNKLNYEI